VSDFRKLHVWQRSHALSLEVHKAAIRIRGSNYTSLRSQLIRSASSVAANIVEGAGQESRREFARFLRYALNSVSELEYHLLTARDFQVMSPEHFTPLASETTEIRRMLIGLLKRVNGPTDRPKV
jgi:four helix bundle protein